MSSTIEYRGLSIELPDGAFSFGKDGSLTLSVDAPTTITLRPLRNDGVEASVRLPLPLPHHCTALARALARRLSMLAAAGATAVIPVVMETLSARSPWQSRPPLTERQRGRRAAAAQRECRWAAPLAWRVRPRRATAAPTLPPRASARAAARAPRRSRRSRLPSWEQPELGARTRKRHRPGAQRYAAAPVFAGGFVAAAPAYTSV